MNSRNEPDHSSPAPDKDRRIADLEARLARATALADEYRALAQASFEGIGFFDQDMRCVACNETALELFGYERCEFLGLHALDMVAPESHAEVRQRIESQEHRPYELTALRKDGSTFPAEVHDKRGVLHGRGVRISALRDITRRKRMEQELQDALNEQKIIFANTKVGLMLLRGGRRLAKANKALADLFGYESPEEMTGLDMRRLHLDENAFMEFGRQHYKTLADTAQLHIEYRLRRKDGTPVWCMLSGQAMDRNKPADLSKGVLWVVDDITRIKDQEERLRTLACTDYLTGVHNRRHFLELAGRELSRRQRHGGECAVLLIDLDRFKTVNDRLGHPAGDAVLKTFARRCCGTLRKIDIFGRLGGEEFAVFLPETGLEGGRVAAERIRQRMDGMETRTPGGNITATVSIGVASTECGGNSVEELITRADQVLYRAKRLGRNRVETEQGDTP
jgi:diguanylate cyclase (GGDEF)-like protein/PAS domain S-box-containing protein